MRQQHLIIIAWLFSLLTACSNSPDHPQMADQLPAIYPDYVGVTVPAGIAPAYALLPWVGQRDVPTIVSGCQGRQASAIWQKTEDEIQE